MKITAAMAVSLDVLTAALDDADAGIAHSLQQLILVTAAAVPTYVGLSVVVPHSDPPLNITSLAVGAVAGDIRTSLHLSLPGPVDSRESLAVAIILYAGSPGTFVDLAADLAWLTGRPPADFVLDQHLAMPALPLLEGQLHAASDINQAIGVLIGRGYTPQRADWELETRAATDRTDRHTAARQILDMVTPSSDDGPDANEV